MRNKSLDAVKAIAACLVGMHPCKLSGTGRAACKSTGKMCGAVFLYGIRVFLLLSKLQCLKKNIV